MNFFTLLTLLATCASFATAQSSTTCTVLPAGNASQIAYSFTIVINNPPRLDICNRYFLPLRTVEPYYEVSDRPLDLIDLLNFKFIEPTCSYPNKNKVILTATLYGKDKESGFGAQRNAFATAVFVAVGKYGLGSFQPGQCAEPSGKKRRGVHLPGWN